MAKRNVAQGQETHPPTPNELSRSLGKSYRAFLALTTERAGATCEWKRYSKQGPWVIKVSDGDRTLLYALPQAGQFEVTVVLGARASQAAVAGRVRRELREAIRSAKPYVEGRPVRVAVTNKDDLASVEELLAVKLDPELPPAGASPSKVARRRRTSG